VRASDVRPPAAGMPAGSAIRVGISSCLLGARVRYDGAHRRYRFATDVLDSYVDWVSVCPEVDIGLGIPRPPIRLERGGAGGVRLVLSSTGEDLTERMAGYAEDLVLRLLELDLCGYILKKDSPSCGVERVKVHDPDGAAAREGVGVFAGALLRLAPYLPVEEEGRLNDPRRRENFIARIFACHRWNEMESAGPGLAGLREFHVRHELLCMARSQAGLRRLGHILAGAGRRAGAVDLAAAYRAEFAAVLRRPPSRKGHARVLRHMASLVSDEIDAADRAELRMAMQDYGLGMLPLVVPLTLIRRHARRQEHAYLTNQAYLSPHPHELMLLNHV